MSTEAEGDQEFEEVETNQTFDGTPPLFPAVDWEKEWQYFLCKTHGITEILHLIIYVYWLTLLNIVRRLCKEET